MTKISLLKHPTQKREAALSNSYGEPLPSDAYGPPRDVPNNIPELNQPAPVYGVPNFQNNIFPQEPPPGAYGPPSPVVFPSQTYEGPPPPIGKPKPIYGPPKLYGPPKATYGPPKPIYGPPKKTYGPPKANLPKPIYGVPFKPPKVSLPKPIYGVPKPVYGPPKPVYGPPKPIYGPPKATYGPPLPSLPSLPPIPELPAINFGSGSVSANFGIENEIDSGLNLPAPVYGTPISLKPNFPGDTSGPPALSLGPVGPNDQLVVHDAALGHYGPPQPDPDPRPPHPGIPAPPTPPHVLYDGWKPIPGLEGLHVAPPGHRAPVGDHYGPPPPPPQFQEVHSNLDGHSLPTAANSVTFSGAQISAGYSHVHQDALGDVDLNAIVGGDSNHIDQSKTVFEAHYIENAGAQPPLALPPSGPEKPRDSYGAPPPASLTGGRYPPATRSPGAKGLLPPSGIYGVPPGGQYGAPPPFGGPAPRHPIKFREGVPEGLLQSIGHHTHHKDVHGLNHGLRGPAYLPPPIRDVKELSPGDGGISLSITPSNLYSLPHAGNPIGFHPLQPSPANLYGSPVDSYAAPLLTVGDHSAAPSDTDAVAAAPDGSPLASLSPLEAAAVLKHCPYHEAIMRAAARGEQVPPELASSYVASLSSLGSTLSKNRQAGGDSSTASHEAIETILPRDDAKKEGKTDPPRGKSIKNQGAEESLKKGIGAQYVAQQIEQTSEKIKNLSEEAERLRHRIVSDQNSNQRFVQHSGSGPGYSVQIQSSEDGRGKTVHPSIPHEQLLSEGLLQSILQAIEQPSRPPHVKVADDQKINFEQAGSLDFTNFDAGGLTLPAGYEPVDRTEDKKNDLETQSSIRNFVRSEIEHHRGDVPPADCDLKADNSVTHTIVVPPPNIDNVRPVDDVDNDVAIFFGDSSDSKDKSETVTEISVATSISENVEEYGDKKEFGAKIDNS
ncbi:unnamed protein product [Diatraea saccharalis]|uniref:Uncharacterized protein n=1 Tax=Diatraea saccharalis TaxID=40085 RepID=A0A9N9R6G3_9NEOP|nr:unnamed protein product [Diatraea saccharalis]